MPEIPTMLEMLQAGVHFGHKASKWHPKMKPYIFGERSDVHIINLEETAKKLKEALDFIKKTTAAGGVVLFVGSKEQAKEIVKRYAKDAGAPYVVTRWLGGTFTNFKTIKSVTDRFTDLKNKTATGGLAKYTKKEQLNFQKEIVKLEELVGGIETLKKLPEAIFVIDVRAEKTAVAEARKKKVPVVALCDTNINPDDVDYPIPSNDDAVKTIEMMVGLAAAAVKEGKAEFETKKVSAPEKPAAPAVKAEEVKEEKK
ncbi:30S ribosomal protein S2 [Candidatus Falkowbacteria bacterium]|nr:30S ribosomal protein S2 [Candidatus Falkowbacteria bacterium]